MAKFACILSGVLALVAIGVWSLFWVVIEGNWKALEERCQALQSEIEARGSHRPVLRGRPLPGNAWADYEEALGALTASDPADAKDQPKIDRPVPNAGLSRPSPALDSMRRGASRQSFVRINSGGKNVRVFSGDYRAIEVARLADSAARELRKQGRGKEAAEILLDACQFARDLDFPPALLPALAGLSDLLCSDRLSRDNLRECARELEILDAGIPRHGQVICTKLFELGTSLLDPKVNDVLWEVDDDHATWRYGFSLRLLKAKSFQSIDRVCQEMRRWDDLPWPEARQKWAGFHENRSKDTLPVAPVFQTESPFDDDGYRGALAQVRVLRVAAHYQATGEVLDLADPFGSRIQTLKGNAGIRIWSVGNEGRSPDSIALLQFHPRLDRLTPEITLEVRR